MSRSAPAVRRQQRARRRARRVAAGLCLHGLCCPLPVTAPAEGHVPGCPYACCRPAPPGRAHVYCARHRTRQGRRGAAPLE